MSSLNVTAREAAFSVCSVVREQAATAMIVMAASAQLSS
jgi:hypothetical protein